MKHNLLLIVLCSLLSCKDSESGQDNGNGQGQAYSGAGYVTGLEQPGANVLFRVAVPQPGNYLLEMRYRNTGTADGVASVILNDASTRKEVKLPTQSHPDLWQSAATKVFLQNGINYIIIQSSTANHGLSELDYIKIRKKP